MFTDKQIAALSAPLSREHVATRTQSGRSLSYIEGWHAIAEANRIFGFDAWHRETLELRQVAEHQRKVGQGEGWGVSYIARVRITIVAPDGRSIGREGVGTGHGIDRDLGLAHESAAKEAETDAMKRALMTFGNPFGLALYDKTQANVENAPRVVPNDTTPGKTDPGGGDDQKSQWTGWVETQTAYLRACETAGDADKVRAWKAKFDSALGRLKAKDVALYEQIAGVFDDVAIVLRPNQTIISAG